MSQKQVHGCHGKYWRTSAARESCYSRIYVCCVSLTHLKTFSPNPRFSRFPLLSENGWCRPTRWFYFPGVNCTPSLPWLAELKHFGLPRFGRDYNGQFVTWHFAHCFESEGQRLDSQKWLSNSRVTFGLYYTCYLKGWGQGLFLKTCRVLIAQLITKQPSVRCSGRTAFPWHNVSCCDFMARIMPFF